MFKILEHLPCQGSRSPDFGAEIWPHCQCQKSMCFFPNSRQKIPNLTKKLFFGGQIGNFWFSIFISYNTNTEHIVTYLQFSNLAMETSYIRTMSNFPNLVKMPIIFQILWAPAPFQKRDVIALHAHFLSKILSIVLLVKFVLRSSSKSLICTLMKNKVSASFCH